MNKNSGYYFRAQRSLRQLSNFSASFQDKYSFSDYYKYLRLKIIINLKIQEKQRYLKNSQRDLNSSPDEKHQLTQFSKGQSTPQVLKKQTNGMLPIRTNIAEFQENPLNTFLMLPHYYSEADTKSRTQKSNCQIQFERDSIWRIEHMLSQKHQNMCILVQQSCCTYSSNSNILGDSIRNLRDFFQIWLSDDLVNQLDDLCSIEQSLRWLSAVYQIIEQQTLEN